jgi:transposase InsO family protein
VLVDMRIATVPLSAAAFSINIEHIHSAPYHPMTQGKIERWHQTLKNRILLENYFLPGDLEAQIARCPGCEGLLSGPGCDQRPSSAPPRPAKKRRLG